MTGRLGNSTEPRNRILVVEDDTDISHLLDFMLSREGFDVLVATDGQAAREMIRNTAPPALVLLDVMLPYVDGFQLIESVRSRVEWQDVPVLMLTAKSDERDIVRALEAGANDYVLKPFQPAEVVARIKRLIKAHQ